MRCGWVPACTPYWIIVNSISFACTNVFPFIMASKRMVTFSDGGASKKRKVIKMEMKLDLVKLSEMGGNSNEHWSDTWLKSFDYRLKHEFCVYIFFSVRDKDIFLLNYEICCWFRVLYIKQYLTLLHLIYWEPMISLPINIQEA